MISSVSHFLSPLSKWVDHCLRQMVDKVPTYLKNSTELKSLLEELPPLPEGAFLFKIDAVTTSSLVTPFGFKRWELRWERPLHVSMPPSTMVTTKEPH